MGELADQSPRVWQIDTGSELYSGDLIKLVIPTPTPIGLDLGLSIAVLEKEQEVVSPLSIVRRAVAAEGVLKVIAESAITPDAWANLHIDVNDGAVWAFGRIPEKAGSWREPVVRTFKGNPTDLSFRSGYDIQTLYRLFDRYMPRWEQLANAISLFDGGVSGKSAFEPSSEGWKVWENSTYLVELIKHPHLNGTHFVVRPHPQVFGKEYQRQWQTVSKEHQPFVQATAEMVAIGLGVDALIDKEKHGQLHISGNWAEGLRVAPDPGGKLQMDYLSDVNAAQVKDGNAGSSNGSRKREKRRHRIAGDFGTKPHLHVYIPKEGTDVVLPRLWKGEVEWRLKTNNLGGYTPGDLRAMIDTWEKISPMEEDAARKIAITVGDGLTDWLTKNLV